jgi:protein involved in polysaccharide export with SLBB domain
MPTVSFFFRTPLGALASKGVSTLASTLVAALALTTLAVMPAAAQDPLNTGPRGLVDVPTGTPSASIAAAQAAATAAAARAAVPPTVSPAPPGPMPVDPALAGRPLMFGSQMFSGRFASEAFSGFNAEYQVAVGDRISLRMWGAFQYDTVQPVDAQGNIFIPNVGPVPVQGVRNAELNRVIETQVKRVFRSSVGVYATLEAAQPVKVYVTGFVRAPGLYGGLSSDSVLYYLDRAGGIDPNRGSYLEVDVLRGGKPRAKVQLYRFLLDGQIQPLQLQDGDTIVVSPRKYTVQVGGEVLNPYIFEFAQPEVSAETLLAMARVKPGATHLSIVRKIGAERRSEYHALGAIGQVRLQDGDEVQLTSDKAPGTLLVRIEGAHLGERTLVLPYGARLKDALARLKPAPQASVAAVQLFRRSVAERQKVLMESSLQGLETYALTARSATSEEAALRSRESQQILEFVERARRVQPRGQVVLADSATAGETLLEDGDLLRVPESSNLIVVTGEVLFPTAVIHDPKADMSTYVQRAGGYTQGADRARVVILHQDGSVAEATSGALRPGDEVMVLPKIEAKNVEIARGITQIIYQIAVAAKVVFGL